MGQNLDLLADKTADIDIILKVELGQKIIAAGYRIDLGRFLNPVGQFVGHGISLAQFTFDQQKDWPHFLSPVFAPRVIIRGLSPLNIYDEHHGALN